MPTNCQVLILFRDLHVLLQQFGCLLKCLLKVPWEYFLIGFSSWGHFIGSCKWSAYTPPSLLSFALLSAEPNPPPQPLWSQECRRVSASVWDLARQKIRVTSTPSHFEIDPSWQLLGEPSDVSISLSKEIARGSTRSPWANQTLHKAQMDALSPVCYCWGGGHLAAILSPPISLNKLPLLGSKSQFSTTSVLTMYNIFKKGVLAICLLSEKKQEAGKRWN